MGKTSGTGNSGSLVAGIMLGMAIGLLVAGGVAWYIIKKNPASFENKDNHVAAKPEVDNKPANLPASAPVPALPPLVQ